MLNGKVTVITGGAGLLGKEFCAAVVNNGGICILADNDKRRGLNAGKDILKNHPNAQLSYQYVNINEKQSICRLIEFISKEYGKIDALVNNAYPRNNNYGRIFFDVEYEDFCENVNLNLGGYFLTSQQFASFFINQGFGNIINISSVYGVIPPRFEIYNDTKMTNPVEYAVIKSGLIHLSKYMAKMFKQKNIRVNTLSLGGLKDNQPETFLVNYRSFCLNKGMLNPKDVSGALVFLLSDHSKFINGQNVIVDDGFTL